MQSFFFSLVFISGVNFYSDAIVFRKEFEFEFLSILLNLLRLLSVSQYVVYLRECSIRT